MLVSRTQTAGMVSINFVPVRPKADHSLIRHTIIDLFGFDIRNNKTQNSILK